MTGPLLASGRGADVYAQQDRSVLRRYRREADVTGEADARRRVAGRRRGVPELPPWPGAPAGSRILAAEKVLACAR